MLRPDDVRARVEAFAREQGVEASAETAFAPWFLRDHLRLAGQEALAQTSDEPTTAGIHAFHLEQTGAKPPVVWLVHAKLSDDETRVRNGIAELQKSVRVLEEMLTTQRNTDVPGENRLLSNLRRAVQARQLSPGSNFEIRCTLLHLMPIDREIWRRKATVSKAIHAFTDDVADSVIGPKVRLDIFGPKEFDPAERAANRPAGHSIRFEGTGFDLSEGERALFGLVPIEDLVQLYDRYRGALFDKNVRMYLHGEARRTRSAAHHIKEALEKICTGQRSPDQFIRVHNGVTLSVHSVAGPDGGKIELRPDGRLGINVLNGCQTVYTAWLFWSDQRTRRRQREWIGHWENVRLPVRIVATKSEDTIRSVTVGANRQTSMKPSAFFSQDPVQLELSARFAELMIYYQRQDGAWEHLSRSNAQTVERFESGVITMEGLARAIAAASQVLPLDIARSPQRIFDDQKRYEKVFAERHTRSLDLLVFLYNSLDVIKLALKDAIGDTQRYQDMSPARFMFTTFRLLMAWIVRKEPTLVSAYSTRVTTGKARKELRDELAARLSARKSSILPLMQEVFREGAGTYADAIEKGRVQDALTRLKLGDYDIFAEWDRGTGTRPRDEEE